MYKEKKLFIMFNVLIFAFILVTTVSLIVPTSVQAQYWAAMPPYNILWPLWSPALSPISPVSGYTTPLVTSITRDTILPVQPALVWDPSYIIGSDPGYNPYLLYNTPPVLGGGLLYYHDIYGLNPWPPDYLLDPITQEPAPISLPLGWSILSPYALGEFEYYVPIANLLYANTFGISGQAFIDLLDPWDIWGPSTRTGVPLTPIILP